MYMLARVLLDSSLIDAWGLRARARARALFLCLPSERRVTVLVAHNEWITLAFPAVIAVMTTAIIAITIAGGTWVGWWMGVALYTDDDDNVEY